MRKLRRKSKKLIDLSKKELILIINYEEGLIKRKDSKIVDLFAQLRNFRLRLRRIRNSIDYLVAHPTSADNSVSTPKHRRDKERKIRCIR